MKTIALLSVLSALVIGVGSLWGVQGIIIGAVIALAMNVGSYYFSDTIVLRIYKAKELSVEHPITQMVHRLAKKADLPMPKVYEIPQATPNAFATGRNPKHSAVAFTRGILAVLNDEELEGVAAHELAHIKNRDTLIATIAATMVSVISFAAEMLMWSLFFGRGERENSGGALIGMLLAPLLATVVQLAISRSREYLADETAAKITKKPLSLAAALNKLQHANNVRPMQHSTTGTASLFIVNPFRGFGEWFSTHPSMRKRIAKLHALA